MGKTQSKVAIKVGREQLTERMMKRFEREATIMKRLSHPGIVPVYEIGYLGCGKSARPYLVMEYVDGTTLENCDGTLTFTDIAKVIEQVADALQHAHQYGIVHRDVKPANIIVQTHNGQLAIRLTDFGLAALKGDEALTLPGDEIGTPHYMSPEQVKGQWHRVDGRSDVYSLGVRLYQLLVKQVPFAGPRTRGFLFYQILHVDPDPPRKRNGQIPSDLEIICIRAMAKERWAMTGPHFLYQKLWEYG